MGRLCGEWRRRERCECPEDARNAARGKRRRFLRMGCVVYPGIYVARCDAVWRGVFGMVYRGICPPWVRGCHVHAARRGCAPAPLPHGASVSSGLPPQETRLAAPTPARRRASRPHQPSEVWRAAALQSEIRIRRHARRIRWPCVSKASLRRPPLAPKGSVCPVGTWAEGPKRPEGVSKYKGCARQRAERRYLRGAGGKAAGVVGGRRNPAEKIANGELFRRAYSILASASLTSSIRRATCAGVSTGWLNSTVWFTVTAGAAACAACGVWRLS